MNSSPSVCVIGAQGTLGNAVLKQFRSAGWTVHPAGRRADDAHGFHRLDLDQPETLEPALRDVDLVVSTVAHPRLTAERWVVEQGGLLVNCSHAPAGAAATLTRQVRESKGTVLLNAGLVPGVANLVAAELLDTHSQADCLEIAFTVLNNGTAGRAGGEFAHQGLTSRVHHRVVNLPMPEPFGNLACIEIAEGEDGGFGGVAGSRKIERYLGFGNRPINIALQAINALRLMPVLPRAAFATNRGEQSDLSTEPTAIWIGARYGAERLGTSMIECEGDYRTTAIAARLFAEKLLDRNSKPGCFNPEDLFNLSYLLPELSHTGIRVTSDWEPQTPNG